MNKNTPTLPICKHGLIYTTLYEIIEILHPASVNDVKIWHYLCVCVCVFVLLSQPNGTGMKLGWNLFVGGGLGGPVRSASGRIPVLSNS